MEEETSLQLLPMPLIPRLDHLNDMLDYIEEKRGLADTVCNLRPQQERQQCKLLNSVLDEVPTKGSLMERVAVLESRVSKLYVEIGQGELLHVESEDTKVIEKKTVSFEVKKRRRVHGVSRYRRWWRWIGMTC